MRAEYFFELFQQSKHLEYFHSTLQNVKKIQQLNAHFTGSYILESSLYHFIFKSFESSGTENYVSLAEIIKPLTEAETFSPYDPFIKMHKAQAYLDFDELEAAKQAAIQAIELEPQYVAALYFLHKNFDYFGGEQNFNERLTKIIERSKHWNLQPGTYLYELVKIPTS